MSPPTGINNCHAIFVALAACLLFSPSRTVSAQAIDFDKQVAPILVSHCLECHQGAEPEGGLRLTSLTEARNGGDSGKALVPRHLDDSRLWARVEADEMPPQHPLDAESKAILKRWIEQGAPWTDGSLDLFSITTDRRAGRDWWSLQPVRTVTPPAIDSDWPRTPIDLFVLRKLKANQLRPSPEADPRQLIRRVYFDLIGLPPPPERVAAFIADPTEKAYLQLVDELLDSKHYGERWGRHWLDVVRFGESDGFERNAPREQAWHYRDWVIEAFNDDMPYDQFARWQLIGDQIDRGQSGAAATGFWVAGVHNKTVGGSDRMKKLARQDEIEEVLGTLGQTFNGLTFHCARCHDHKFDPISQKEYYQLAASISGLRHGEREVELPAEQAKLADLDREIVRIRQQLAQIDDAARRKVIETRREQKVPAPKPPVALARWEFDLNFQDSLGELHGKPHGSARIENGTLVLDGQSYVQTAALTRKLTSKTLEVWVELEDLKQRGGAAISLETLDGGVFDAIVFGEQEAGRWMAGSNHFARSQSFHAPEEHASGQPVHIAIVYQQDGTIVGYRNGLSHGRPIRKAALQPFAANETEVLFGLRHRPAGGNRYLKARIHRAALYGRALSPAEVAASAGRGGDFVTEQELIDSLEPNSKAKREKVKSRLAARTRDRQRQAQLARQKVYSMIPGPAEETHVLLRGDPDLVDLPVSPGTTDAIAFLTGDFGLPVNAPEAIRRRKLADWITHRKNPLFVRTIVNRIWHYHFGRGIVETPNDLGFNGGAPSHPELLDFLANEFQQQGYRMKWLHRQIVMSSTYRQAAFGLPVAAWRMANDQDAENRWLWRGPSRRLEAESVRDAILHVAGKLNLSPGGPGFRDVSVQLNNGTTYYEPIETEGPEFWRRTVYRFSPRGGRVALLDAFDCPDPASTAPRRSVTTTPLQSLSLLNSPLVIRMSEEFAQRVRNDVGDEVDRQVDHAWWLAIARKPTPEEREKSRQLVSQHGLPALCRGLFNLHEFVVIE